jgi:hypothetical protein
MRPIRSRARTRPRPSSPTRRKSIPRARAGQGEQGSDEESEAIDPAEEEIEHEGRKYLVPKALKPLLLMQADYTRKTQEVAEQRRAVMAERLRIRAPPAPTCRF